MAGGGAVPKAACLQKSGSAADERESAAPKLTSAIVTVLNSTLEGRGWKVTPSGDGSGFAFEVRGPTGGPMKFELPTVADILDRVARGETGFAELEGAGVMEGGSPPDWVPVYPGARSSASTSVGTTDLVIGGGVYVADASASDVLMWYHNWADRMRSRDGFLGRTLRYERDELPIPGSGDIGRFALIFDLWSVAVFVTEDDHGGSLLVVLYKKFAEGGGVSVGEAAFAGGS